MDISIRIGGKAGQGIQSISSIIAKTFVRNDFFVFINQDAEARIRGGHNFDQIRISNDLVYAVSEKVNILIALDDEAIQQDMGCLDDAGLLLFDVENNYTGQFANFFHKETGLFIDQKILRYDGRPFTARDIIEQIQTID